MIRKTNKYSKRLKLLQGGEPCLMETTVIRGLTKCLGLSLVFMGNSALWEKFNFCFSSVFS